MIRALPVALAALLSLAAAAACDTPHPVALNHGLGGGGSTTVGTGDETTGTGGAANDGGDGGPGTGGGEADDGGDAGADGG